MPKLDEGALRRPDFKGGTPVVLADGQTWFFPPPTVTPVREGWKFVRDGGGPTRMAPAYAAGSDEFADLLDRYVEAEKAGEQFVALADLAFYLLSLNYTIGFDDTRGLFARYFDSDPRAEASDGAWDAIADVVMGRSPKASAGGSGPA